MKKLIPARVASLGVVMSIFGLGACSSPDIGSPAWVAEMAKQRQEDRAEQRRDVVSEIPSWYLSVPKDGLSLYGAGTATSTDLQMALDKATLLAKRDLADHIKNQLSSKIKQFTAESGSADDPQFRSEVESVTTNMIAEVDLSGYELVKKTVSANDGLYRVYALAQYPMGSANRVLMERLKRDAAVDGRLRASKAFLELEQDIRNAVNASSEAKANKENDG